MATTYVDTTEARKKIASNNAKISTLQRDLNNPKTAASKRDSINVTIQDLQDENKLLQQQIDAQHTAATSPPDTTTTTYTKTDTGADKTMDAQSNIAGDAKPPATFLESVQSLPSWLLIGLAIVLPAGSLLLLSMLKKRKAKKR